MKFLATNVRSSASSLKGAVKNVYQALAKGLTGGYWASMGLSWFCRVLIGCKRSSGTLSISLGSRMPRGLRVQTAFV